MGATTELTEAARRAITTVGPSVVRIGRHGGRGMGVVAGEDLVLTNAHNLRDRTTQVTFADGRAEQGRVLGADIDGDLAVLAVPTGSAPPMTWAEEAPRPGDVVFAVAQPAGGPRVTFGLVSGTGRSFRGPRGRRVEGSLEHTAPLARGTSGSPVTDDAGRMVGISTARLGDGFYLALPADAALRQRVDALARGEAPTRRVLGVGVAPAPVARRLRAQVGLPARDGLLVRTVAPGGPAERAGLTVGDLVVAAGGSAVTTVDDLHQAIDGVAADSTLAVVVVRGVEEHQVRVHLDPDDGPTEGGTA